MSPPRASSPPAARPPAREAVVVVNRRARWLREPGPVLDAVTRPRVGVHVVETRTLDELERAADALAADPPRVVVLAGGDGTYGTSVSALHRAFARASAPVPALALAPAGTTCTIARNWSWHGGGVLMAGAASAARACARLVDAVATGAAAEDAPVPTALRPSLCVSTAGGSRLAFIVGAGLVSRFFEIYDDAGAQGYRTAAAIVARVFVGSFAGGALARRILEPAACALTVDGVAAPFDRVSLVVASVVRDLGLSMRLTHRAGEALDRFHVVATPLGARALGPQMPLVLAARPLLGPRVDELARELTMRFPPGAGAFVVDGDLVRADVVTVTAGPTFRVLDFDRRPPV